MNDKKINIFESVISENIAEISTELLEVGIDILLKSEIIKEIPLFGLGYKTYTLVQKIEDYRFTKKVLKFLFELKSVDSSTREKFIQKIEADEDYKDTGEKLLLIIHKLDETNKSTIIGKLFLATIKEKIAINDFFRLARAVENTFLEDLLVLKDNEIRNVAEEIKLNLFQGQLLIQKIKDNREREGLLMRRYGNLTIPPSFEYKLNKYGKMLIDYGL